MYEGVLRFLIRGVPPYTCIYVPAFVELAHPCHSGHRARVSLDKPSSGERPGTSSVRAVHTSYTARQHSHSLQCGPGRIGMHDEVACTHTHTESSSRRSYMYMHRYMEWVNGWLFFLKFLFGYIVCYAHGFIQILTSRSLSFPVHLQPLKLQFTSRLTISRLHALSGNICIYVHVHVCVEWNTKYTCNRATLYNVLRQYIPMLWHSISVIVKVCLCTWYHSCNPSCQGDYFLQLRKFDISADFALECKI